MAAPLAVVSGPAIRAVGDGAPEDIVLVTRCPDTMPVVLRDAEKSTTDQASHQLTRHLLGRWTIAKSGREGGVVWGRHWSCGAGMLRIRVRLLFVRRLF